MITLKTLPNATAQEVADQMTRHLLTQMKRSVAKHTGGGEHATCHYRGEGGLVCAAGCLIGNDEYSEKMEVSWRAGVEEGYFPRKHNSLISSFQDVHDIHEPTVWKRELGKLYNKYKLKKDVFEEFA